MELKEFMEIVSKKTYCMSQESYDYKFGYGEKSNDKSPRYIYSEECIGGKRGGSCWGGTPSAYINADGASSARRNFDASLDNVIEAVAPNITYIQYRQIVNSLLIQKEHTESEYYGNYSSYIVYLIDAEKLYDKLREYMLIWRW